MESERLRIAVFTDSALPILNGVSISVNDLITELRRLGHSVHLFTCANPGYLDPDPNTYRFRSIDTFFARGYPLAIPPFYRMLRKFRKHEFDVIHTHTPFTLGFVGLRWAESHDIPLVSTYHTLYDRYVHYIFIFPRRYLRFRLARHTNFYYNNAQQVITPSAIAKKWLRRHSVKTPITVIPTGVKPALNIDRTEARAKLGIGPEQKILLYVGRLAREKNLDTLLETAKIAFAKDPALRLWMVGDGTFREETAAMVRRLGIGDRVKMVGAVPRADVDQYYGAADLFVFSSISETQGLVVSEANSYGLPAVVVTGGGASEGVQDGVNGFVVKNDPAAFADRILATLSDDILMAQLGEGARRIARMNTPEMSAQRVVEVYRKAIRGHAVAAEASKSLAKL